jgi:Protein of unknown function (DUF3047)
VYSRLTNARSSKKRPSESHLDEFPSSRDVAALLLAVLVVTARAADPPFTEVGKFAAADVGRIPSGWNELFFPKIPRHTTYEIVRDADRVAVKATSVASASALVRKIDLDPRDYPILEWRWKIVNLIANADVGRKSGDDYPARVYVTFEYDPARVSVLERAKFEALKLFYGEYPPIGAIDYIWDGKAPLGAFVPNAFSARVKMIVVESGASNLGRWIDERRDVLADYRRAFGSEPPRISGVAIMTDSDNTGESATAYYADIRFTN